MSGMPRVFVEQVDGATKVHIRWPDSLDTDPATTVLHGPGYARDHLGYTPEIPAVAVELDRPAREPSLASVVAVLEDAITDARRIAADASRDSLSQAMAGLRVTALLMARRHVLAGYPVSDELLAAAAAREGTRGR